MKWEKYFERLSVEGQKNELKKLFNDQSFLNAILDRGHSDIHYFGNNTHIKTDWNTKADIFYDRDRPEQFLSSSGGKQLPECDKMLSLINRVAAEHVHSSEFFDRETALMALHETVSACRFDVMDWLNKVPGKDGETLSLFVNLDTFLGCGIALNGSERVARSCVVVLDRGQTSLDGDLYPFRIKTCYPNIVLGHETEGIWATGRNFANELKQTIAQSSLENRMFWAFYSYGENCSVFDNGSPFPTCFFERNCDGINFSIKLNGAPRDPHKVIRWKSNYHGDSINEAFVKWPELNIPESVARQAESYAKYMIGIYENKGLNPNFYTPDVEGNLGKHFDDVKSVEIVCR